MNWTKSKNITIPLSEYERLVKEAADVQVWKERGDRYAAFNEKLEEIIANLNKQLVEIAVAAVKGKP